jgi:DDE superfamily endonuclease/Helix-turn-helix of DDE superfamily endonuclease
MLNRERILNEDRLLRSMTGLNRQAFDELSPIFAQAYYESLTPPEMIHKRTLGGGLKGTLKTIESKLFYGLFYCKCYPTFDLAGVLFDFDRAQAHHWAHRLLTVLETALGKRMVLPERKMRSMEEFIERFPGVKRIMFDGTERPIQRPKDNTRQKENYSGKKKRHTRKHMATVDENKRVLILSKAREGKVHDKRLLNEEGTVAIPDDIPIEVDLGFQGLDKEYENIRIPHKKPRGGELTEQQKLENRALSQDRVLCENAFAGVKKYNCVAGVYRNLVTNFDDRLMLISSGLWNFYLEAA